MPLKNHEGKMAGVTHYLPAGNGADLTLLFFAKPLGLGEDGLFTLAGYLSPHSPGVAEADPGYSGGRVDPYVAGVLAREPADVQRALIAILTITPYFN